MMRSALWFLLAVLSAPLAAQQRAQLSGVLRDSSGAVVPEASVSVLHTETGFRRVTRTNAEGVYAVTSLLPGEYKVTVRKPGFRSVARLGVDLGASQNARLDFLLELGSLQETVTVEGNASPIHTNDAGSVVVLGRDATENLPLNGSALQHLISFAPGVIHTPATAGESGQFSANGQRPNTNYFTVDGVSANNGVGGSGLPGQFSGNTLPGMTAIGSLHGLLVAADVEELRIHTSTFAPEFGRMPGAQVSIVTRSGTNDFHGSVFTNLRHENLSAADWFANSSGIGRLPRRLQNAGLALGGPVRRNRTFFFSSFEHLRLRHSTAWRTPVPSLAARRAAAPELRPILDAFPIPNGPDLQRYASLHHARALWPATVQTGNLRLDHALSARGVLFARYNQGPSVNRFGYLQYNRSRFVSRGLTGGVTVALSPPLTNDFRISVSRIQVDTSWQAATPDGAARLDLASVLPPVMAPGRRLYGLSLGDFGQLIDGDGGSSRQDQWNVVNTLAISRFGHQVRFGIDYQRLRPSRLDHVTSLTATYQSLAQLLQGSAPDVSISSVAAGSSLIETLSFFTQDVWQLRPRLTLTFGTRWEITPAPVYAGAPVTAVLGTAASLRPLLEQTARDRAFPLPPYDLDWRTRLTQLAPRAGLAWLADPNRNLVLRGGFGLFYDLGFTSSLDLLNGAPHNRWAVVLGDPRQTTLTGVQLLYGFAEQLRLPYTLHWNLTVERGLAYRMVLSAGYVGSAGRRLLRRESGPTTSALRLILATNSGKSDYHGLQLQLRRNVTRGLRGFVGYTWGHAIDNGSWDSATYRVFPAVSGVQDRGPSNFDVRHTLRVGATADLPHRWQLSGVVRARTAFPIDIANTRNFFGLAFDNSRPDVSPGQPVWIYDAAVPGRRRINPRAFLTPAAGTQGTLGRNALRGNGLAQLDLGLQRRFVLPNESSLRLRIEAFNLTNSPIFADPVRYLNHPLFGQSTSLADLMLGSGSPLSGLTPAFQPAGARTVQLSVGFSF
jgi:hypothetical protein